MSFYRKGKFWVGVGITVVALLILQQVWHWEFERVEVPSGKVLVRIHKWGKNLGPDQIVAPDESYQGVMSEVKTEGRYFLNPVVWSHEIHDMVHVRDGKYLVLTRKFGTPVPADRIAAGDVLARVGYPVPDGDRGQEDRGIVRDVLQPGSYPLNRYAYDWKEFDIVVVAQNQVGVRTLKAGPELPRDQNVQGRYVVPGGYRGVQREAVPPGKYLPNPYVESIIPVEAGYSRKVLLTDIEFPSRDGFNLKPHVQVEYAVMPEKAPELFVRLSDDGALHQEDATKEQMDKNEVLQKVVLPYIRGFARIEGSNFAAADFIEQGDGTAGAQKALNARERLQGAMETKVKARCADLGVLVRSVNLADMGLPDELKKLQSDRKVAEQEQKANRSQLGQLKSEQERRAKEALSQQNEAVVTAETRLRQAEIDAERLKEVEKSRLETQFKNAQLRLDAAKKESEAMLKQGKADADVIMADNEAAVAGLRTAVKGFNGPNQFAQYQMLMRLGPALAEIFASDESEFAKVFASYMAPATAAKPPANGAGGDGNK